MSCLNCGNYTVPPLPPGEYEVTPSMNGFRSELRRNLAVHFDAGERMQTSVFSSAGLFSTAQ
jgi:hypothetical protein